MDALSLAGRAGVNTFERKAQEKLAKPKKRKFNMHRNPDGGYGGSIDELDEAEEQAREEEERKKRERAAAPRKRKFTMSRNADGAYTGTIDEVDEEE